MSAPSQPQHTIRNAVFAIIAGAIVGLIYEGLYFLTNNHHSQGDFGFIEAAGIGAATFLIAFLLNLVFTRRR